MRSLKIILFFLLLVCFTFQSIAYGDGRKITVTGKSEIVLDADYAVLKVSLKEIGNDMPLSHEALLKSVSDFIKKLKDAGLSGGDIKKSLEKQGKEYAYERNSRYLKGYYSECYIDLYVRKISKLSDVYKVMAGYPDLQIRSTEFKRNDEFEIRKEEYEKALKVARMKAVYMARALDAGIGKVYSIQENNSYLTRSNSTANIAGSVDAGSGYGTIKITAQVTVEFELE